MVSGSQSASISRLDRVQMRIRGGEGRWGLWCLVSSMATDRVVEMEGL